MKVQKARLEKIVQNKFLSEQEEKLAKFCKENNINFKTKADFLAEANVVMISSSNRTTSIKQKPRWLDT
jgi:hypothetical protein